MAMKAAEWLGSLLSNRDDLEIRRIRGPFGTAEKLGRSGGVGGKVFAQPEFALEKAARTRAVKIRFCLRWDEQEEK